MFTALVVPFPLSCVLDGLTRELTRTPTASDKFRCSGPLIAASGPVAHHANIDLPVNVRQLFRGAKSQQLGLVNWSEANRTRKVNRPFCFSHTIKASGLVICDNRRARSTLTWGSHHLLAGTMRRVTDLSEFFLWSLYG